MQQTLEQTIVITYGDPTTLNAPNTGIVAGVGGLSIIVLTLVVILAASFYFIKRRTSPGKSFRGFGIFTFLVLAAITLVLNLSPVSAAPTLTLSTNQQNLTITIPKGGGTATTHTTVTTSTANPTGYALSAALTKAEPGIDLSLQGGNTTTSTLLTTTTAPLSLHDTTSANTDNTTDTTNVTLTFTVDGTVTEGTKTLMLVYEATDNEVNAIQSFTMDQCAALSTYTGTNENAVRTVADNRGGVTRYYRVAKLADNNCWMLDNLKLGSTKGSVTLTSDDSNVASDFTLPTISTTGTMDISTNPGNNFDTPYAYGPVPGDTGAGATNYGYLYNWSAATAGETRTSITSGDVSYSICPAGWHLPIGGDWNSVDGNFANLDQAFGGTGMSAYSGEANIAKWQYTGPFKGTLAGNWYEGFNGQGNWVGLWSRSTKPDSADDAFSMHLESNGVLPGFYDGRNAGLGVRCLRAASA